MKRSILLGAAVGVAIPAIAFVISRVVPMITAQSTEATSTRQQNQNPRLVGATGVQALPQPADGKVALVAGPVGGPFKGMRGATGNP